MVVNTMSLQNSVKLYFTVLIHSSTNYLQDNVCESEFMTKIEFWDRNIHLITPFSHRCCYSCLYKLTLLAINIPYWSSQEQLFYDHTRGILFLLLPINPWSMEHISFLARRLNPFKYVSRLCQEQELLSVWRTPYYGFIFTQLKSGPH